MKCLLQFLLSQFLLFGSWDLHVHIPIKPFHERKQDPQMRKDFNNDQDNWAFNKYF